MNRRTIEYKVMVRSDIDTLEDWLNEQGDYGWELIRVFKDEQGFYENDTNYIFMRLPKQD